MKSDQDTSKELSVFGKEISLCNISFQTDNEDKLSAFWNLEHIGIKDSAVEDEDDRALQKFNDKKIFKNSRYYVTWPWKHFDRPIASNYTLALGRLKTIIKRFKTDQSLLEKSDSIINVELSKRKIEKVVSNSNALMHYIQHLQVITPSKTTTKFRFVYDAAAKTKKENPRLNECLYRGPIILEDLVPILLRFRLFK